MNDQIVVDRVCAEAQLPTAVRDRAVAHLRLLAVKMRGASGAISKHAVACALAATQLGAPFDRKKLVNLSGVNEAAFQQAFASMQSLLRIRFDFTVETICNMAQLPSLAKASRRLFDAYRERRLAQMDATLRASASFDDQPALAIAAVELAARKKKVTAKFDSVALCASTNVTLGTYRTTYDQVMSVCFPQWFAAEQQSKLDATADRQKRAAKEAARDPETKRKFDDDYEDWRERVTARSKDRNAGANDAVAAPRKQTTLSSFVRRDDDGQESVVPSVATDRNEIDDSD